MSGDILDQIDRAIEDYEVSDDAMRWTPDPPKPKRPAATAWLAPSGGEWAEIGILANDSEALPLGAVPSWGALDEASLLSNWDSQSFTMTVTAKISEETAHWFLMTVDDHQMARCRFCNPSGNPRPSLHGAAYRRRQLTRRRRR